MYKVQLTAAFLLVIVCSYQVQIITGLINAVDVMMCAISAMVRLIAAVSGLMIKRDHLTAVVV